MDTFKEIKLIFPPRLGLKLFVCYRSMCEIVNIAVHM